MEQQRVHGQMEEGRQSGRKVRYYLFTAQRAREDDKSQRQRCPTMQLSTALVAAEKKML